MLRKKTGIFIVILAISFVGLLWLQYYWISLSFQMKSEEFDTRVNTILSKVAESAEESFYCIDFFSEFNVSTGEGIYLIKHKWDEQGYLPGKGEAVADTIKTYFLNRFQDDTLLSYSDIKFSFPANIRMELNVEYLLQGNTDFNKDELTINSYRESLFNNDMFITTLDTLLESQLRKNGIMLEYQYAVQSADPDSVFYANPEDLDPEIFKSSLSTILFNDNYFFKPVKLLLFFPGKKISLINELWLIIAGSIFLIVILIILIIYFIRTLLHQQKLSEMKSDFISNMTHEFKTPVANINLALDTLESQNMLSGESSHKVAEIIREENQRMQQNIDLILETSLFDNGSICLRKSELDLHDLLSAIIDSMAFEMTDKKGTLLKVFEAKHYIIIADEVHLSNTIFNLIDNALKYTDKSPEVEISTRNIPGYCILSIKDHGMGIPLASLDKIFDKFYRVPQGDKHDVKGFGLGLYYVKQIIDKHSGKIKVKSEFNKGSTFEIWLPLK
jgi:signal transduction histidine kinase